MRNGYCHLAVTVKTASRIRDEYGHDDLTWSTKYSSMWVAVKTRVRAASHADGDAQIDSITFTTPYHEGHDIAQGDRITWEGDDYEIRTVMDRDGLRRFLDLESVKVAA